MNKFDFLDETLMAFADDALSEAERAMVASAAAGDARTAARIEAFRNSRWVLESAFEPLRGAPLPASLTAMVYHLGTTDSNVTGGSRWRWPDWMHVRLSGGRLLAASALAAGLLGLTIGYEAGGGAVVAPAPANLAQLVHALPKEVAEVLERTPSGDEVSVALGARNARLLPLASYGGTQDWCRELAVSAPSGQGLESVQLLACRSTAGWHAVAVAEVGPHGSAGRDYVPASGGQDLARALGLGMPIPAAAEDVLLHRQQ
ncbi:MAG: hypothetical protein KGI67_02510 [Pseudomonadota bacterium]|nr:hypothetical protein [Pseudomonadota bacterium]